MSAPATVLVVSGGAPLTAAEIARLPPFEVLIAADSGLDRAMAAGLDIDVAIGDFDSASALNYLAAEKAGVELVRHPPHKDETDLELAMLRAIEAEPDRIVVVALDGGRLDHFLASLLLLGDDRFAAADVDAELGQARLSVVRDRRTITGSIGDVVTLLPMHGPALGVRTSGLEYPLRGETLAAGSPRGVSNVLVSPLAVVEVDAGVVMAIVTPAEEAV